MQGKWNSRRLEVVLRELEGFSMHPAVVQRVLERTGESVAGAHVPIPEALAEVVAADVVLATRVLRLADCAHGREVRTLAAAQECLGEGLVRSTAVAATLLGSDPRGDGALDYPAFLRHSLAVAHAAKAVATELRIPDPQQAYLCGLLHDIGKLAMNQLMPKTYARVLEAVAAGGGNIADIERDIVGVDHGVVGRHLAMQWRLPRCVQETAWLHLQPVEAIPPQVENAPLVAIVALADMLARRCGEGFSGNSTYHGELQSVAGTMGISAATVEQILAQLPSQVQESLAHAGLGAELPPELLSQTLHAARIELGRMNQHLSEQVSTLNRRASAFERFQNFASVLTPESTVSDVLAQIARTLPDAAGLPAAGETPVVAYCLGEAQEDVLAVRYEGNDRFAWRSFTSAANTPSTAPADAASAMAAVMADVGELADWISLSDCEHVALASGGRWVGGVLFGRRGRMDAARRQGVEFLAGALGMALAIAQGRCQAMSLSEQFAGASQVLSETQDALAEARALSALSEMAAGAGHELNTPLAVISGRAQVMRELATEESQRKAWQTIADQAQRVSDIVTDLMEFAAPASPNPVRLEVGEVLQNAIKSLTTGNPPQAAPSGVDIHIAEETPPILADAAQTQAILAELLANAVRAAGADAAIHIRARRGESGRVLISVQDFGPGMDDATLVKAFTPFFSVQQAGRRRGLGLPRARRYAELNGGRVYLASRVGHGTTAFVELPSANA